ncbi:MAG: hypothetical protein ABEJ68_08445 [Halobacteriaceae archaeon]
MTNRYNTRHILALCLCAVLVAAAVAPTTAVAQSSEDDDDDSLVDAVLGTAANITDQVAAVRQFAGGIVTNARYRVFGPETERTPSQCVSDIQSEINTHNGTYEQYVNSRINASESRDVVAIRCALEDEDGQMQNEQVYAVADVVNGSYQNLRIVNDTSRDVDHVIRLSGIAAQEMPDDLVSFREDYAANNKTPGAAYKKRLAGKYMGSVHGTFEFLPDMEGS